MMMRSIDKLRLARAALAAVPAALLLLATTARAADVEMSLSSAESYVGAPVTIQITIRNADDPQPPTFPQIANAVVRFADKSMMTSFVNGTMSQSVTFSYQLTPLKAGTLTIPSIDVMVDGKIYATGAQSLLVSKSETGDLMWVDLVGARDKVYVGQQLDVTLRLWIKPFSDPRIHYKLSPRDMWGLVDLNNSQWGMFRETIERMAARRSWPQGRETMRNDSQGHPHAYYLYQIPATMTPQRPGALDASSVSIIATYPTRLEQNNALFSMASLSIAESRPVTASIKESKITVKPLPTQGRPAYFRDAVGQYSFATLAAPREVAVGDPITLTLTIRGKGKLDTLQPPPLNELPELVRDFKVPSDPLAGKIENDAKTFSQTIRARTDKVAEVPALPFAYFDPDAERYVTVRSLPIPIKVKPVSQLSVSQVVQAQPTRSLPTQLTERTGGILPNYTDSEQLLAQQSFSPGLSTAFAALAPPLIWAACWLFQRRAHRLRTDVGYARRRAAARKAAAALSEATKTSHGESPRLVAAALRTYVSDRLNLPPGSLTSSETVSQLNGRGVPAAVLGRIQSLLTECEAAQYSAGGAGDNGLAPAAEKCIAELERQRL